MSAKQVRTAAAYVGNSGSLVTSALIAAGVDKDDRFKLYNVFSMDRLYTDPDLWSTVRATREWRVTALCFMASIMDSNDWKNL
jgi:hypothetical protein